MDTIEKTAWRRLGIEAAAIIVSILLAFAIDAWWGERQAKANTKGHVLSAIQELDLISGRLERSIRLAGVAEDASKQWLEKAPELPLESLNSLLGDMVMWATADVSSPSVEALISSGAIDLIVDPELRAWILGFSTEIQDFVEEEDGSILFVDTVFVPYLAEHGVSLGNSDPLEMGFKGRAPKEQVAILVNDWGFESLVIWRATKARDVIDSAHQLMGVIDEGRALLESKG